MISEYFYQSPIWLVFVSSALLFLAITEVGFRIGCRVRERRGEKPEGSAGLVTGSLLGLVSFVLAFTFGFAASNHADKREIVVQEANAIGTAYLRADLLADQVAAESYRAILLEYAQERLLAGQTRTIAPEQLAAVIDSAERLHGEMWALVSGIARVTPSPSHSLVVSAVNDVIDLHGIRVAVSIRRTIPEVIWLALYFVSGMALGATAYRYGVNSEGRPELLPSMVIAFTAIITLIADLEDHRHGFLTTDQAPMEDLLRSMERG